MDNDTLLALIDADSNRWHLDGIDSPDLLIVSGDVVQGVPMGAADFDSDLAGQYEEALDFLDRLTERFLEGDRQRAVIVPGNHDVCWPMARNAMQPLDKTPERMESRGLSPASGVRWDWNEQQAFEITDADLYERRLTLFREFRRTFYQDVTPNPLRHDQDLLHLEWEDLDLMAVGLSSWHGNDCFCPVGDIEPRLLAVAQRLVAESEMSTAVAVWHHNIAGGPHDRDYMDDRVVHRLIDAGFVLGLHGHQHRADAAPYELRLPNMSSMCVVSAGSLCVGDAEIPTGENRQFNLVDVRPYEKSVTIHVRQMSGGGLFARANKMEFGGNPYLTLELPVALSRPTNPGSVSRLVDEAIAEIAKGGHERAIDLLDRAERRGATDDLTRIPRLESYVGCGNTDAVVELIGGDPRSADEVAQLVAALVTAERYDEAQATIDQTDRIDEATRGALMGRIEIGRATS